MNDPDHHKRDFLRHTLATLAYRGGKVLRNAPADLANLRVTPGSMTGIQILAHINDLLDWSVHLTAGTHIWNESKPGEWPYEVKRFNAGLLRLDAAISAQASLGFKAENLFQGPVADALTHIGQIAQLRRLAGSPVRGENYFIAKISAGRVGDDQAKADREFD